jgi:hypothetical protein
VGSPVPRQARGHGLGDRAWLRRRGGKQRECEINLRTLRPSTQSYIPRNLRIRRGCSGRAQPCCSRCAPRPRASRWGPSHGTWSRHARRRAWTRSPRSVQRMHWSGRECAPSLTRARRGRRGRRSTRTRTTCCTRRSSASRSTTCARTTPSPAGSRPARSSTRLRGCSMLIAPSAPSWRCAAGLLGLAL